MQSTASVIAEGAAVNSGEEGVAIKTKARRYRKSSFGPWPWSAKSGFGLIFEHLTATVETVRADVVAQVRFASGRLHGDAGHDQCIVGTVHAALGRRLLVLLDGHDGSWTVR
jgi:hypothetical protein